MYRCCLFAFACVTELLLSASSALANCTVESVAKRVDYVRSGGVTDEEAQAIKEECNWVVAVNACTFGRVLRILVNGGSVEDVRKECDK